TSCSPNVAEYAAAYVNAAASPSHLSDTATAKITAMTAIARKSIPKATTPAAARLPVRVRRRVSSRPKASEPTHSTAPSPHPERRQPASRNTGNPRTTTASPAIVGRRVGGAVRGSVQAGEAAPSLRVAVLDHGRGD